MKVVLGINFRYFFRDVLLIITGSVLYAVGTVLFIFPHSLLLGGTSGISVIIEKFILVAPGTILMIINFSLTAAAFIILGRNMAFKTFIGSIFTAAFIGIFEKLFTSYPIMKSPFLSSVTGAALIAVAGGVMFYVGSSSGGTDIIAQIIQKFSKFPIGRALLISDISIVLIGSFVLGIKILILSFLGLLIKTFGIDCVIFFIKKVKSKSLINIPI